MSEDKKIAKIKALNEKNSQKTEPADKGFLQNFFVAKRVLSPEKKSTSEESMLSQSHENLKKEEKGQKNSFPLRILKKLQEQFSSREKEEQRKKIYESGNAEKENALKKTLLEKKKKVMILFSSFLPHNKSFQEIKPSDTKKNIWDIFSKNILSGKEKKENLPTPKKEREKFSFGIIFGKRMESSVVDEKKEEKKEMPASAKKEETEIQKKEQGKKMESFLKLFKKKETALLVIPEKKEAFDPEKKYPKKVSIHIPLRSDFLKKENSESEEEKKEVTEKEETKIQKKGNALETSPLIISHVDFPPLEKPKEELHTNLEESNKNDSPKSAFIEPVLLQQEQPSEEEKKEETPPLLEKQNVPLNPFAKIFEQYASDNTSSDTLSSTPLFGDMPPIIPLESDITKKSEVFELQKPSNTGNASEFSTNPKPVEKIPPTASDPKLSGTGNTLVSSIIQGVQIKNNRINQGRPSVLGERFSEQIDISDQKEQEKEKQRNRDRFLAVSRFFFVVSLLAPISSFLVFDTILDAESNLSDVIEAKNYGKLLVEKEEKNKEKDAHLKRIIKESKEAESKINSIQENKVLSVIIENRIDFLEVMLRINGITLKSLNLTSELNRAIQMLVFNSYAGSSDGKGGVQITIAGNVRDPKKMSLTKLTQLMETINEDKYFEGASLRSFSKTDDNEGGSRSSFTFNFTYSNPKDDEALLSDVTK